MSIETLERPVRTNERLGGRKVGLTHEEEELSAWWYGRLDYQPGMTATWTVPKDICPGGMHGQDRTAKDDQGTFYCRECGTGPLPPPSGQWSVDGYRVYDASGEVIEFKHFDVYKLVPGDAISIVLPA